MSKFSEKGYFVKENAPIYLTTDMDRTVKWFEDVLGWYRDSKCSVEILNHVLFHLCRL